MHTIDEPAVTDPPTDPVRVAYDRIAGEYEDAVAGDDWMRQILWRHYANVFRPGSRVLDVACGTGLDALHLSASGVEVTAIDISPRMIDQLLKRAQAVDMRVPIDARILSIADLHLLPAGTFDGLISAFAGLNTVPDIEQFARDAFALLRPNGRMVIHLLNRFSLWEWLGAVGRRDWGSARTVGTLSEREFTIGGVSVRHRLYAPLTVYRDVFAANFQLERVYSLGCLRPPHTVRALPSPLVNMLGTLDEHLGSRRPLLDRGRFFVLQLVRRPEIDDGA